MKIVTSEDIRNLEEKLEKEYSFPAILLMENAALFIFNFLKEKYGKLKNMDIAIICGPGNNGGDGVALARYLYLNGFKNVTIFSYLWDKKISDLLRIQLRFIENHIKIRNLLEEYKDLQKYDLIVDSIFGIGLKREVEERLREVFSFINNLNKPIISIDIPSGINSDTGEIMGDAIKATYTLSMFLPKLGFFNSPAVDYIGELLIGNLGIPINIIDTLIESRIYLVDERSVSNLIRIPSKGLHKGKKGRVLIIGGSIQYTGAPILSALSALRIGCGMVYLAVPEEIHMLYRALYPEIIYIPLKSKNGFISGSNVNELLEITEKININAVGIGPGIGVSEETKEFVIEFLKRLRLPTVIDADALSYIADILEDLNGKDFILTPHYGEMVKIIGGSVDEIIKNRFNIGKDFVKSYNLYLLLKGPFSLFFTPNGEIYVNPFADSLLATAGSGDVLTGIISGLLAQGYSLIESGIIGNYIHGKSSELWKRKKGRFGLIASDIIQLIPTVMEMLVRGKNV